MPWYKGTFWTPRLPSGLNLLGPEPSGSASAYDVGGMKRPSFPEQVRAALEAETERKATVAMNGYPVLMYRCGSCGQFGEGHLMHVGHKVTWKDYIAGKQPLSEDAAKAAYSDLDNLRYEHAVCNTSHQFEGGPVIDPTAVFETLIAKYAAPNSTVSDEAISIGNGARSVRLSSDRTRHRRPTTTDAFDFDNEDRPAWYNGTRDALIAEWYNKRLVKDGRNPEGKVMPLYWCVSCHHWCEAFSMQLGHKVKWKEHAQAVGATTRAEVFQSFNDLDNLAFECSACNQGHEWEEYDENAPEFNYSGQDQREKQAAVVKAMQDEAAFFRAQMMPQGETRTAPQAAVLTLLTELRSLETVALFDSTFSPTSGRLKGIPANMLSQAALKKAIQARYTHPEAPLLNSLAPDLAELFADSYQENYVKPLIAGWNSEYGAHAPLAAKDLDSFRNAMFQKDPKAVKIFGMTVSGEDIGRCRDLFVATAEKADAILGKFETYEEHQQDQPVQTSGMTSWASGVAQTSSSLQTL